MPHLIDAQRLIAAFKESNDASMPGLVFALLDYYFEEARSNSTPAPFRGAW